jgi:hypothetical protein
MRPDINWDAVAKLGPPAGAPARPEQVVKAIARHKPIPAKPQPGRKAR